MIHGNLFIVLSILFAFFMAWGVGANDVANAMGTSVGSKALTIAQAILVAAIFEAAGSMLAGGQVTATIRSNIINIHSLTNQPVTLIYGMLSSLLAAGTWLVVATRFGWPVSTTHSIVGAIVGFGLVVLGYQDIYWSQFFDIFLSWILTPIIAGVFAFLLFRSVQVFIFNSDRPIHSAKKIVPIYIFLVAFIICLVTLFTGLKHIGLNISKVEGFELSLLISAVITVLGIAILSKISHENEKPRKSIDFRLIEKIFAKLMIFTACAMAFAHGSNDVANAIGPLAAVVSIVQSGGQVMQKSSIPLWVMGLGAVGIVLGLIMYGHKVIATIGTNITQLTPSRGFAAQFATAATVIVASGIGLPVSTTQTLVGAVLGVGLARGMAALNLNVVRNIFFSWVITLPIGAILAIIYYYLLRFILGF